MKLRDLVFGALAVLSVPGASAQEMCFVEEDALYPAGALRMGTQNDLAFDGGLVVVGSRDDGSGTSAGVVWTFQRSGSSWVELSPVVAFDAAPGKLFGEAVALDGDTLAVGAWGDGSLGGLAGAVYVYRFVGGAWTLEQKLLASDGAAGDAFGLTLGLAGDELLVGAPGDSQLGLPETGAVYAFRRSGTNWSETQKLSVSNLTSFDFLGRGLKLRGTRALVGADTRPNAAGGIGSVYVFDLVGGIWIESAELAVAETKRDDLFGIGLALDGDVAMVGASQYPIFAGLRGAVFVFERVGATWVSSGRIEPGDLEDQDKFGTSIAMDGELALIGSPYALGTVADSGKVYVFERESADWVEREQFTRTSSEPLDEFGILVALQDSAAAVFSLRADDQGPGLGALVMLALGGAFESYGAGHPGTGGLVPLLSGSSCALTGGTVDLVVAGGLPGAVGGLFIGRAPISLMIRGATLLVAPPFDRLLGHVLDGQGAARFPLVVDASLQGLTFYAQAGYLDAGASQGVSASAGLRVQFR